MPFVKLDAGVLDSTLWSDDNGRIVFLTALLMAEPREFTEPVPQISVRDLKATGWSAPSGWYGFVPAAGIGIVRRAGVDAETGLDALERLGSPENQSRSPEFDGRRLVRVDGGYLVLNFQKYRDRDYTAAERSRRYRNRVTASRRDVTAERRDITQPEAEAEAEVEVEESKSKAGVEKLTPPSVKKKPKKLTAIYDDDSPPMKLAVLHRDQLRTVCSKFTGPKNLQRWARACEVLIRDHDDVGLIERAIVHATIHKTKFFMSPGALLDEWPDGSSKFDSIVLGMNNAASGSTAKGKEASNVVRAFFEKSESR